MLVPGGFGERGFEGKIETIRHCPGEPQVPFLGICYGMQAAVVEYARNVCGIEGATTAEFAPEAEHQVINLMEEQKNLKDLGGTMRLGAFDCALQEDTLSRHAYGYEDISERHRHRYEYNNAYRDQLTDAGLKVAGVNPRLDLVEIVELSTAVHPWFVGVQFHPEYKTKPQQPHPLFRDFVGAAIAHRERVGAGSS